MPDEVISLLSPRLKEFVYQVIVEGNPVMVFDKHVDAIEFVKENFASANALILPIAVFSKAPAKDL